jgi:AraC-like DNA-binding protein
MNAVHRSRVIASPSPGVYATEVDSGRHYAKHWHTTYGFGLIDRGAHRSASPQGAVDAFEGDIVCMNPGDVHDGRPLGGPSRRWFTVYVEPEVLASIARRGDAAFTKAAFTDAELHSVIRRLLARMQHGSALAFDEALTMACGLMLERHSTWGVRAAKAEPDLRMVCERLADAPLDAPTLGELAALAGIGKFQLLRRFRRQFGATPHDWLLQRRADRARALIRAGLALGETAAACGFADQSHMTRVFVQRFGFTPGAWREAAISFKTRG